MLKTTIAPPSLPDLLEKAYAHFERQDFARAAELCEQVLELHAESSPAVYLLGLIAHRRSDLNRAERYLQRSVELDPHNALYCSALAEVFSSKGKYEQAIAAWQKTIRIDPSMAEAHFNLANLYFSTGRADRAEETYQQAVKIDPSLAEAHYNLGNLHLDHRRYEAAETAYRRAVSARPDYAEAHFNLGIVLMEQNRGDSAIDALNAAIRLKPEMFAAYYNLGCIYHGRGKLDDAIENYRQAIATKPDFAEACNNLGNAYFESGNPAEAERWLKNAVRIDPGYADGYYNLGKIYQERFEFEAAMEAYQKALQFNPEYSKACNNIAKIFHDRNHPRRAIKWYRKAIAIQPDYAEARFNMANTQLLMGDFKAGWEGYEWRFRRRNWRRVYPHRFDRPRWDGRPFAGKTVFVHSEQGLGDVLQFVRYLPLLKALGGQVIFETVGPLLSICGRMPCVDRVVAYDPGERRAAACDYYIPLLSLPAVFETDLDTIPNHVPYLNASAEDIERWRPRISQEGFRVGLVWAGTSTDPRRACPLGWFTPLTRLKGVHFFGLQKGIAAEQIEVEGMPEGMWMVNLGQEFEDFSDTAAVVHQLDLVISIDTSVAHLAGAMGKPLWLLLPDVPDWRWLMNRDDSPWYPTARLFRQRRPGDWQPVIQGIADALVEVISRSTAERRQGRISRPDFE